MFPRGIAFPLFNLPYCVEKLKSRKNNCSLIFFHRYVQPSLLSITISKSSFIWFTVVLCIIAWVFIDFYLQKFTSHISLDMLCVLGAGGCDCLLVPTDGHLTPTRVSGREEARRGRDTPGLARAVCRVSSVPRTRSTKLASSHQSQSVPARLPCLPKTINTRFLATSVPFTLIWRK